MAKNDIFHVMYSGDGCSIRDVTTIITLGKMSIGDAMVGVSDVTGRSLKPSRRVSLHMHQHNDRRLRGRWRVGVTIVMSKGLVVSPCFDRFRIVWLDSSSGFCYRWENYIFLITILSLWWMPHEEESVDVEMFWFSGTIDVALHWQWFMLIFRFERNQWKALKLEVEMSTAYICVELMHHVY